MSKRQRTEDTDNYNSAAASNINSDIRNISRDEMSMARLVTRNREHHTITEYDRQRAHTQRLKNLLGRRHHPAIYTNFRTDEEGFYSMTRFSISADICRTLLTFDGISRDAVITDAFAGVGGNTIMFAKFFASVRGAEIDTLRHEMLLDNLRLFRLNNAKIFKGPYQYIMNIPQDVIFFDPPWGLDYKSKRMGTARIFIGETYPPSADDPPPALPLENLIIGVSSRAKYIVVKLPVNYDFVYFDSRMRTIGGTVVTSIYYRPYSSVIKYVEVRPPHG